MRFMIIVKATPGSEAGAMPEEGLRSALACYHEQLAQAGVLLDGNGLHPSNRGWRVLYRGGRHQRIDGPFSDSQALMAGYTLIQVRSREEAIEWTRRFPAPMGELQGVQIEVRQLFEREDREPAQAIEHP